MSTIIKFQTEDVMQPQPWPIGVDDDGKVTSGLGPDDGAHLVGFGPRDEWTITVLRSQMTPENVVGLSPTFSDGHGLFQWRNLVSAVVFS
jgi:hypothetical protein